MSRNSQQKVSELPTNRFEVITGRLKEVENVSKDIEIATLLGMDKSTFSNAKRTGSIPYSRLAEYSRDKQVSLEYLINGKGPVHIKDMIAEPGAIYKIETNQDSVYTIAKMVIEEIATRQGVLIEQYKIEDIIKLIHRDVLATGEQAISLERVKQLLDLTE